MEKYKQNSKKYFFLSIYLFAVIFSPPILPRFNFIMGLISSCLIVLNHRKKSNRVFVQYQFDKWLFLFMFFFLWCLISAIINAFAFSEMVQTSHYKSLFNRFVILVFLVLAHGMFLICEFDKRNYNIEDYIKVLTYAGLIESFMCISAFLSPAVKNIFIKIMRENNNDKMFNNNWFITVRSYGFAGTLVDVFGLAVSLIAATSFLYGILCDKKYIILSIIVEIPSLLNARTGVVLYAVDIIIISTLSFFSRCQKNRIRIIAAIFTLVFFSLLVFSIIKNNQATYSWVMDGVNSMVTFLSQNQSTSTMKIITSEKFWYLPENLQLLIGTGHSRYGASGYPHTDNGFVNDIWLSGLLGVFWFYSSLFKIGCGNYKKLTKSNYRVLLYILGTTFLIFNIKGCLISGHLGGVCFFLHMFLIRYFLSKNKSSVMSTDSTQFEDEFDKSFQKVKA